MDTRKIGSLTEVYANGGGYVTEAYPTNFHHFWKQKVLVGTETANGFKEVTAAEMETLKKQDANWVEPSESLKERAKTIGAVYNDATGYFEFNTLTDLTADDMEAVITYGKATFVAPECNARVGESLKYIRTNWVQFGLDAIRIKAAMDYSFYGQSELEVLQLPASGDYALRPKTAYAFASKCNKLHTVLGYLDLTNLSANHELFSSCPVLKKVDLRNLNSSIVIKGSPLLSVESVRKMVSQAINTTPISITVHPDVFAKLSNTDAAAYVPENLLLDSDTVHSNTSYPTAVYQIAGGAGPKEGDKVTVTIWGELGSGCLSWPVYNSGGTVHGANLSKVVDGVYRATFDWPLQKGSTIASNTTLDVYAYPNTSGSQSTINKIKMEYGENSNPVWTPALSEISDAALREKAQWASVMQMAQARQISFVEAV